MFIVCNEASVALLGRSDQWLRFMTVRMLIDFHLCECCFSDALNVTTCWLLNWVTQPSVVDSNKMHNCNFVVEVDGYISTQKQEALKRWEYERLCLCIHAGLVGGIDIDCCARASLKFAERIFVSIAVFLYFLFPYPVCISILVYIETWRIFALGTRLDAVKIIRQKPYRIESKQETKPTTLIRWCWRIGILTEVLRCKFIKHLIDR